MNTDYSKIVNEAWEQATQEGDGQTEQRFYELVKEFTTSVTDWHAIAIEAGLVGTDSPAPSGVAMIAKERQRQIEAEGWTSDHDDGHRHGALAIAAACYAMHSSWQQEGVPLIWPWEDQNWKPKDPISDLVRAGALIAAELDRRLRLL